MGAAAVDAIVVPGGSIHEGFDEEAKGIFLAKFELLENITELGVVATTLSQVREVIANLVVEKALYFGEVDELRNTTGADRSSE